MNGILHWNKRQLYHNWWNNSSVGPNLYNSSVGGNLYYRIPYTLEPMHVLTQGMIDNIEKIVDRLFKRNPDYINCHISMVVLGNKATTSEYVTACVVTDDSKIYNKIIKYEYKSQSK